VLSGYSLHAGIARRRVRLDLGAYAMGLPEFVHGNAAFGFSFHGFGVKLQLFPFAEQQGFFVGVDTGVARVLAEHDASGLSARDTQISLGANLGYRVMLAGGLYVSPWIGVGYAFGASGHLPRLSRVLLPLLGARHRTRCGFLHGMAACTDGGPVRSACARVMIDPPIAKPTQHTLEQMAEGLVNLPRAPAPS
jgi:hypothetical protein